MFRHIPKVAVKDKVRSFSSAVFNRDRKGLVTKEESDEFNSFYPKIREILIETSNYSSPLDLKERTIKFLDYVIPNGKQIRGLTTIAAYKKFVKSDKISPEDMRLATILGWIPEILQGAALVLDDITDNSVSRRGKLCWYKQEDVGLNAVVDGIYLIVAPHMLLRQFFSHLPCYTKLRDLLITTQIATTKGQTLDVGCWKHGKPNWNLFSLERYQEIVEYKTTFYTFYFPIISAMYFANIFNEDLLVKVRRVLSMLGLYIQVQDDFIDCFGDEFVTGKKGTDIQEAKCTWLAIKALEKCSEEQRKIMETFYGRKDDKSVKNIKCLYSNLGLKELYRDFEEETALKINKEIMLLPDSVPGDLFYSLVQLLYKRNK